MKNFKMIIQYDGTKYSGWQKQGNTDNTIQNKFENLLSKMTKEEIEIHGSGRTDAGVHALGQVANFKTNMNCDADFVLNYCNEYLPKDIRVKSVEAVDNRFHSRLSAVSKHYRYRIASDSCYNVFERKFVANIIGDYDIEAMKKAADFLVGQHDFKGFCDNKHMKKSTVRSISMIDISESDGVICFDFYGDGFLYHMVRLMTGLLVDIGLGKQDMDSINRVFEGKVKAPLAPAEGLSLIEVFYEE